MIQTKKQKHLHIVIKKLTPFLDPHLAMWAIPSYQYEKAEMRKIFSKIKALKLSTLVIASNREISLLKDIHEISFPNLMILNLTDNGIQSLQNINTIQIPRIKHLNLDYNVISKISTFRKAVFFELTHLNLTGNRIQSLKPFHEFFTYTLSSINLKYNQFLQDISTLILIQFPLQNLLMENTSLIERKEFNSMIDNSSRFPTKRKFHLK